MSKSIKSADLSVGSKSQVKGHKRGYDGFLLISVSLLCFAVDGTEYGIKSVCWYLRGAGLTASRQVVLCLSSEIV